MREHVFFTTYSIVIVRLHAAALSSPWVVMDEVESEWKEIKSKSRDTVYYYNCKTGESAWQIPTKKQEEHVSHNSI